MQSTTPNDDANVKERMAWFQAYKAVIRFVPFPDSVLCEVIRAQGDVWLAEFGGTRSEAIDKCFAAAFSFRLDGGAALDRVMTPTFVKGDI